ncbi:unnamed protein product, partial [Coregonus sp. 'balchen']
ISVRSIVGFIESFSMYQALQRAEPDVANALLQRTHDRFLKEMGVTSPDTSMDVTMEYFCVLASKPDSVAWPIVCLKVGSMLPPTGGTVLLAPHFSSVVGTDVSPAQLEVALDHATAPNISYRQCRAEELPFADRSVDLVTAMSAFHWFDRPRFLQEAHRILKPKGCLALLNYTMDMELHYGDCYHNLNTVCKEFYAALLPYRNPCLGPCSVALYKESYDSIPYTEKEWQECMLVKRSMSLSSYIGMIESFSSYQALLKKDPEEASRLSTDITHRLLAVMGVTSPETELVVGV